MAWEAGRGGGLPAGAWHRAWPLLVSDTGLDANDTWPWAPAFQIEGVHLLECTQRGPARCQAALVTAVQVGAQDQDDQPTQLSTSCQNNSHAQHRLLCMTGPGQREPRELYAWPETVEGSQTTEPRDREQGFRVISPRLPARTVF